MERKGNKKLIDKVRFVKEKMVVFGEKQKDSCCFSGEGVSRFTQIDKTICT